MNEKKGFGGKVVKHRRIILIVALLLLIPSFIGMQATRINYDMLTYLPEDMDTVKGQDILMEDFGKGAISNIVIEGMSTKEVSELKAKIEAVDHVDSVIWYDSIADTSVPMELLPEKYYDAFNNGDATMMIVIFDTTSSSDEAMDAIKEIRSIVSENVFVTGLSAIVTDLKDLCEQEEPIYVGLAVLCATIAMMIFMDSWIIPFIFLASIGCAIMYNMGTNFFFGEISYITKALSAVLQLAVTMDYSIFLWHSYEEQKELNPDNNSAMAKAINQTLTSVIGSSTTTVAGFLALCFMSYTLGMDLGLVMAKGVVFGVLGCVTVLPAMILALDKAIEKTRHRAILPNMEKLAKGITKNWWVFLIIFVIVLFPAIKGYTGTNKNVYYDMSSALPESMESVKAATELDENFDLKSTYMILIDSSMTQKDVESMLKEINEVDGIQASLGLSSVVGPSVPLDILPDSITDIMISGDEEMLLVMSEYQVASDEVNEQVDTIQSIIKKYDDSAMIVGEAPATKDLIEITNTDFNIVTWISIAFVFVIIAFVFRSLSLPIILVAIIEFAIFINLGIPYYTGQSLPFIAPIIISTIQLGSTVDYAILMTTRYKQERIGGADKRESITTALSTSMPSIIVSAASFFAATFGVAVYSNIDMISSMCTLLARGAAVSMVCVIFMVPSMLMLFDRAICKTTGKMTKIHKKEKSAAKTAAQGGNN